MRWQNLVICLFIAACLLLVTVGKTQDLATHESAAEGISFDPLFGTVIATSPNVVAWTRFDLDRSKIGREEPVYHSKCFIQHLGAKPVLVSRGGFSRGGDEPAVILPDDTLLVWRLDPIHQFDSLLWLHGGAIQRQVPLKIDGAAPSVRAIFPDGIVAESRRDIWWVPILDGHVNVLEKKKMGNGGCSELSRFKNQIVWANNKIWPSGSEQGKPIKAPLYIFDMTLETTAAVNLRGSRHQMPYDVLAFDGRHVFDGQAVIEVPSGQTRELDHFFDAIGIIDNVVYCVERKYDAFELQAMHLDRPDRRDVIRRIVKSALSPKRPSAADTIPVKTLFFVEGDALYAWNGTTWENVLAKR